MTDRLDVAIASCVVLPEPDPDAAPLLDALRRAGLRAEVLAWDDPAADFSRARLTVLRSTWNYPAAPAAFDAWLGRVASQSQLFNPLALVRWNLHKRYLLGLERAGIPVVPTRLLTMGARVALADVMASERWEDVVVKPAISAASMGTMRVRRPEIDAGERHLAGLLLNGDVLVQPYQRGVDGHGERALVWIDGDLTHAVRKAPRFAGADEAVSDAVPIAADEAAVARRAIALLERPLLYARIDVAPGPDGPRVMELELIEPSLFLSQSGAALERLVRAIVRIGTRP
ncbi:MAG: hypothetical protein U0166_25330 [Acidobacteriota bacterium]